MEALASPALWGSPLGLLFILAGVGALLAGLGVLVWGASNDRRSKAEIALKERQFEYERRREEKA